MPSHHHHHHHPSGSHGGTRAATLSRADHGWHGASRLDGTATWEQIDVTHRRLHVHGMEKTAGAKRRWRRVTTTTTTTTTMLWRWATGAMGAVTRVPQATPPRTGNHAGWRRKEGFARPTTDATQTRRWRVGWRCRRRRHRCRHQHRHQYHVRCGPAVDGPCTCAKRRW